MLVKKALLQLGGVGICSGGGVEIGGAEVNAGGGISRPHNSDRPDAVTPWMTTARATTTPKIEAEVRVMFQDVWRYQRQSVVGMTMKVNQ